MSMISELLGDLEIVHTHLHQKNKLVLSNTVAIAIKTIKELSEKLAAENMERSTSYYNGGWIPIDFPPEEDDSYMVAWIPTDRIITNCRTKHFYAIFEYENEEWSVDVPEEYDKSEIAILAWRHLPKEYRVVV